MTTRQEKIDRLLGQYGKRIAPDPDGQSIIDQLHRRFSRSNSTDPDPESVASIAVEFIENPTFNALAVRDEDIELVAVYSTVIDQLASIISWALGHTSAWPTLPMRMQNVPTHPSGMLIDWNDMGVVRNEFVSESLLAAIYFIIMHEIGHHVRGHLMFLSDGCPIITLSELGLHRRGRFPALTIQALECYADRHATQGIVETIIRGGLHSDHLTAPQQLCARLFGVGLMFGILDEMESKLAPQPVDRTHPPAQVRFTLVTSAFKVVMESRLPDRFPLDDITNETLAELERYWNRSMPDLKYLKNNQALAEALIHESAKIGPTLMKLARERRRTI